MRPWTQPIAGLPLAVSDVKGAVRFLQTVAPSREPAHVHLVNAYSISLADRNPALRRLLDSPGAVCFPDGKPMTWLSRLFHQSPTLMQVRGPSLFAETLATAPTTVRHYFLGGTPDTLNRLLSRVANDLPNVVVAGYESPPFRALTASERDQQRSRIVESRANLVWVGLGTPKQDYEAARISAECKVLTVAVGAAFDFYARTLPEAPSLLRTLGLEWLYRLVSEPRRLWRRYTVGSARFLVAALRKR